MKKTLCFIMALMLISSSFITANAATRDEVINTVQRLTPSIYDELFLDTVKNIFSQIETTDEQCDKLIEIMERSAKKIDFTKGHSIHNFSDEEVEYMYSVFDEICALLNISYKIVPKESGLLHPGDIKVLVYGQNGELIGELDGDIVKRTDAPDKALDFTGLYVTGGLLLLAAVAFLLRKKLVTD
ncbi:MAG: hypothetical protein ACI4II_02610 [Acutalibacteraceae bacterium]